MIAPANDCIGTKLMGVLCYFHLDVLRFFPVAVQSVDGDSIGGFHARPPSGIVMCAGEIASSRLFFIFEKSIQPSPRSVTCFGLMNAWFLAGWHAARRSNITSPSTRVNVNNRHFFWLVVMRVFITIFHWRWPGGRGYGKALIGVIVERTTAAQQNMSTMQEEALEEFHTSQVGYIQLSASIVAEGKETKTPENLAGRVFF